MSFSAHVCHVARVCLQMCERHQTLCLNERMTVELTAFRASAEPEY